MTTHTYRMSQSNRSFLAHKINLWLKGKKNNVKLSSITRALHEDEFPENEEIELWNLVWFYLDERRKSAQRDEFIGKVEHAVDSIRNPLNYEPSYNYTRLMESVRR